jgi:addiction module RelB/DinJ family antitoxin
MNTTLQIRIDKKTKEAARKKFESMGLDLSSGVKYLLTQVGKTGNLSYICDFGYKHEYTSAMAKKYEKEVEWTLKHGKKYASAKEMFDDLEKNLK